MDKKRRALGDQGTTLEHRTQVNSGRNTKPAGGLAMKQPPAGYIGLVGIGFCHLEEDGVAAGIRNLREVWEVRTMI